MGQVSKEKLRNLKRQTNRNNPTAEKSTRSKTVSFPKKQEVKNRRTNPNKVQPKFTQRLLEPKEIQSSKRKATSWHWHWSHPYLMTAFTFLIALTGVLLHGLDLLVDWPFHGASNFYDAVACVCGLVLIALCFSVYRELPTYAAKGR